MTRPFDPSEDTGEDGVLNRRRFIKTGVGITAAVIMPSLVTQTASAAAASKSVKASKRHVGRERQACFSHQRPPDPPRHQRGPIEPEHGSPDRRRDGAERVCGTKDLH